jgi:hypothetical protein
MYTGVINVGAFNELLVIPFSTVERTVMYREKFAGMYSSWSYSFSQVRYVSKIRKRSKIYTESTNFQFSSHSIGCHWDTLCIYPSATVYVDNLSINWLLLDSTQTPMVLLHHILFSSLLCLHWLSSCFTNPQCWSCDYTGIIIQQRAITVLRFCFTCTCKSEYIRTSWDFTVF